MLRMISSAADTHVGHVRAHNEDALRQHPAAGFLVVADGMGGHAAGEVASVVAVEAVEAALLRDTPATLVEALLEGNRAVQEAAVDGRGMAGMGCTLVACQLRDGLLGVAWVGDSRAYLLRDGGLGRLSHDHSYVQTLVDAGVISAPEAETHPDRNVLTRSLGTAPLDAGAVGQVSIPAQAGDRILLCSDGLTNELGDLWIESILVDNPGDEAAVGALIASALAAGGSDNVTVALATLAE